MRIVKVEYTVKEGFAEQNRNSIQTVMQELKTLNNKGIMYSTFVKEDGLSFVHIGIYPNHETQNIVAQLPAFQKFRQELMASEPKNIPQTEELDLVASAYDFFV